jgi:tRNA(fMet)-specific endonuclease VapC
LANNHSVIDQIELVGVESVGISVITEGELIYMAENSEKSVDNLATIEDLIDDLDVYPIDSVTSRIYGKLKAAIFDCFGPKDRSKRRRTRLESLGIGENDLWIAATAIQHDFTVVSGDHDFLRIQEAFPLKLENWYLSA